jgi:hypothetical protein
MAVAGSSKLAVVALRAEGEGQEDRIAWLDFCDFGPYRSNESSA